MGQEMRAHRLDIPVGGLAEMADGLEVLLSSPALRQDGEGQIDLNGRHLFEGRFARGRGSWRASRINFGSLSDRGFADR